MTSLGHVVGDKIDSGRQLSKRAGCIDPATRLTCRALYSPTGYRHGAFSWSSAIGANSTRRFE